MSRSANRAPLRENDCVETSRNASWHYFILAAAIVGPFFVTGSTSIPADGELDPSFGNDGVVMTDFNNSTDLANAVALQSDGKLVVAGKRHRQ